MKIRNLIEEIKVLNERKKYIDSITIFKNGENILSETFNNYTIDTLHPIYSITKSVVSLVYGIAISEGLINGLDIKIKDIFPEISDISDNLILENILTMTEGLEWDEMSNFNNEKGYVNIIETSPNPYKFIFEREKIAEPGEKYQYSSGSSQVLVEVFERITNLNFEAYTKSKLFEPLGIDYKETNWKKNEIGQVCGGYGLSLSIKDFNKLAKFIHNNGNIEGIKKVEKNYFENLSKIQTKMNRSYSGYSYHFWITNNYFNNNKSFGAFGHRGQRIYHFPKINLTVAIMANITKPAFGIQENLIKDFIL